MLTYPVIKTGTTGTGRQYIANLQSAIRLEVEFIVEAVGGTPTLTYNVQGLRPGGDPTVAADWDNLGLLTADSTVAASNAAITVSAVGSTRRYIDGLDKRFYDAIGVNVTANTNVTYRANINRVDVS